eukprot:SAG11_NODE_3752_length_2251_cov_1.410781_2_plen_238_part_01
MNQPSVVLNLKLDAGAGASVFEANVKAETEIEIEHTDAPLQHEMEEDSSEDDNADMDDATAWDDTNGSDIPLDMVAPHARSDCRLRPFARPPASGGATQNSSAGPSAQAALEARREANLQFCPACYCWMCDRPAAECPAWAAPASKYDYRFGHCMSDASDSSWRTRREARRAQLTAAEKAQEEARQRQRETDAVAAKVAARRAKKRGTNAKTNRASREGEGASSAGISARKMSEECGL